MSFVVKKTYLIDLDDCVPSEAGDFLYDFVFDETENGIIFTRYVKIIPRNKGIKYFQGLSLEDDSIFFTIKIANRDFWGVVSAKANLIAFHYHNRTLIRLNTVDGYKWIEYEAEL